MIKKTSRWYASTLSRLQRQLKDAHRLSGRSPKVQGARINRIEQRIVLHKLRWGEFAPPER